MSTSTFSARSIHDKQVEKHEIAWLWPSFLAAGKLTVLDGDPGCGKSMITVDLAARLSRAAPLPDGAAPSAPCKTLILNSEDDPDDTLLPRLKAAGADSNLVFIANSGERPQLPRDLPNIEAIMRQLGIGLLVIDPLTGFVPPHLAHGGQSAARLAIAPLALLAARTNAAVLLVRHLTKKEDAPAIRRGLGSMSIAGLARTGLIVGRNPRDPTVGLLAVAKTNLAAVPDPLAFRLKPLDNSVVVDWLGPVAGAADDACRRTEGAETPGVVRATLWLIDALAEGPRHAAELLADAKAQGISEKPFPVPSNPSRCNQNSPTTANARPGSGARRRVVPTAASSPWKSSSNRSQTTSATTCPRTCPKRQKVSSPATASPGPPRT
jgi:AAA domain